MDKPIPYTLCPGLQEEFQNPGKGPRVKAGGIHHQKTEPHPPEGGGGGSVCLELSRPRWHGRCFILKTGQQICQLHALRG